MTIVDGGGNPQIDGGNSLPGWRSCANASHRIRLAGKSGEPPDDLPWHDIDDNVLGVFSRYIRGSGARREAEDILKTIRKDNEKTAPPADHGSLESDIRALCAASISSDKATASTKFLIRTMGEISGHPKLLAAYRTHLLAPRIAQIEALIERSRARKELRDVPTDVAAAAIAGPLLRHSLVLLVEPDWTWPVRWTPSVRVDDGRCARGTTPLGSKGQSGSYNGRTRTVVLFSDSPAARLHR